MRTLRQTIESMPLAFDSEASDGLVGTIQIDATGDEPGSYHLRIDDARCTFHPGPADHPNLTIDTPSEVWMEISDGRLDGRDALVRGLYRARGDSTLLMRLGELFGPADAVAIEALDRRPPGPLRLQGMQWLLVALLPWLLFRAGFGWLPLSGAIASLGALLLAAAIVAYRGAFHRPTAFELGSLMMLALLVIVRASGGRWGPALGHLSLAGLWLGMLAARGMPVTTDYSKWRYVEMLWENSAFVHTNAILSLAWGGWFLLAGLVEGLQALNGELTLWARALPFALMVPLVLLTARYPRGARDRRIEDPERLLRRMRWIAAAGVVLASGAVAYGWTIS